MILTVVGTGSSGNVYLLEDAGETLILDAGLPLNSYILQVRSRIVGALITHEHGDHSRGVKDLLMRGIHCYGSQGTWDALKTINPAAEIVRAGDVFHIRRHFTVRPFPAEHDAAEPLGFLIRNDRTGEQLIYATDTAYIRYTFPAVHYWLVECNYCDDLMNDQFVDSELNQRLYGRLVTSHMSLDTLKEMFAANDLRRTRKIVLCHLSDSRSDEDRMVREISELTDKPTVAANTGMKIPLNLTPF